MYLLFLSLFCFTAFCKPAGLRVLTYDLTAGVLDIETGILTCASHLVLPNTSKTCKWVLGNGTRGQTTAMFYQNQTTFFLAQEACEYPPKGRTGLFSVMGPFCSGGSPANLLVHTVAFIETDADLAEFNVAWDHTCNVVVIAPDSNKEFATNQVSDYDGQQRYQTPYSEKPNFQKVPGVGALDFGKYQTSWKVGQEWNCGDTCTFYTISKQVENNSTVLPHYLIGRTYRTGQTVFSVPDSLQLESLSWNIFAQAGRLTQFLGLGVCCSDSWCHPDCKYYNPNTLVLVTFSPSSPNVFSVIASIGDIDADTIRLGVEYSPAPFSSGTRRAYVFHQKTVIAFDLVMDSTGFIEGAVRSVTSPPVQIPLRMWWNSGYN